jgi:peptide/nickel transport system permease protein
MFSIIPRIDEKPEKKYTGGLSRRTRITRKLTLVIPATILLIMVIIAIFADLSWLGMPDVGLAPHDPESGIITDRFLPPAFMEGGSSEYLLGTDRLGRDVLSRVLHGTRISLSISMLVICITAVVGAVLGIVSGYLGGRIDGFIMRVTDMALSFPAILLALLIAVAIGEGYWTVVLALSILGWAGYTRMVRGEALRLRDSDFVAQARISGASSWRIMLRHIFPNTINSLIVMMTLSVGMIIIAESTLSYLGIGVTAPTASWGNMVADGRTYVSTAWWISFFPGIAIGLVVMSGNFLGDWIRDRLDPRLRQV